MLISALIHMLDTRQTDRQKLCHRRYRHHHRKDDIPTRAAGSRCSTWAESWYFSWNPGEQHQTKLTSSARCLASAFCMWGPEVAMVPGPAFACEQLRQPSGVSHTHNRKTRIVLLNRFSLLPSWFREGYGDVQTQHTLIVNKVATLKKQKSLNFSQFKKKKKKISSYCVSIKNLPLSVTSHRTCL